MMSYKGINDLLKSCSATSRTYRAINGKEVWIKTFFYFEGTQVKTTFAVSESCFGEEVIFQCSTAEELEVYLGSLAV